MNASLKLGYVMEHLTVVTDLMKETVVSISAVIMQLIFGYLEDCVLQ